MQGFEFQRMDFLQTLCDLCNEYGWNSLSAMMKRRARYSWIWADTQMMDGSQSSEPTAQKQRQSVIFEHGRNAAISVLRESTANMANVLDCWGAGEEPASFTFS